MRGYHRPRDRAALVSEPGNWRETGVEPGLGQSGSRVGVGDGRIPIPPQDPGVWTLSSIHYGTFWTLE